MNEIMTEYGGGLFALAVEEGLEKRILEEVRVLSDSLTEDYLRLLINPNLTKEKRVAIVGELLDGRVHPYTANFVKLMTERRLASALKGCFCEYERLYYEKFKIVRVLAESAIGLTDEQKKKLEEKLEKHIGQQLEICYEINPSLIGGVRIRYSNRELNDSVRQKLDEIGAVLTDTVI